MDMVSYIAGLRRQAEAIENQKTVIASHRIRMTSRWGSEPFVDTTKKWVAELDRRHAELVDIADKVERGAPIY
jgi:predicted amidohydrolase